MYQIHIEQTFARFQNYNFIPLFHLCLILETRKLWKSFMWTSLEKVLEWSSPQSQNFCQMTKDFFTPNQAEEREVRLKASGGWLDELVDGQWVRSNPWICVPLALKTMFFFLSTTWLFHLQANGRDLDIAIDVEAIVF